MVCKENGGVVGSKRETKIKPRWWTEECSSRKKERKKKVKKFIWERNNENNTSMNRAKKILKRTLKKAKEGWERERWQEINEAENMSEWWRGIRKFRVRKRRKADTSIGKEAWREHFDSLLNPQGQGHERNKGKEERRGRRTNEEGEHIDIEKLDASFSEYEIEEGLNNLANGKAPGEDGIMGEFLRTARMGNIRVFTDVFNKIWKENRMPEG